MDPFYRYRRNILPKRTSELIALMALSTTLFLFLHTRDLNTKLKEMEIKIQPDSMVSANQLISSKLEIEL
ncbi:hypothetical protein JTB14_029316 [Gonioctena quinquepunctata]|nr:hypothetical protein JTB14_029316 [Gonioctena quinquepunctata]